MNLKKKRCLSFLLTLALTLSLAVSAGAAGTKITVAAPETLPDVGESFAVTVSISDNPGICVVQFALAFDETVVDCTEISTGEVTKDMMAVSNPDSSRGAIFAAINVTEVKKDGVLATFLFTVLADGDAGFTVNELEIGDFNGDPYDLDVEYTAIADDYKPVIFPYDGTGMGGAEAVSPVSPGTSSGSESGETENGIESGETTAEEEKIPTFPDTVNHWAKDYISEAVKLGLFVGYENGNFGPDNTVTRAQFVTVLWRLAGRETTDAEVPFTDISNQPDEFKEAIAWAYYHGYIAGLSDTEFGPEEGLTREQAMRILFMYNGGVSGAEILVFSVYDSVFPDSSSVHDWAKPAMYWGVYQTIISGVQSGDELLLDPQGTATRAQIAKIMVDFIKEVEDN